jgi:hypothetical protein
VLEVVAVLVEVVEPDQVVEALTDAAEELEFLRELLGLEVIEGDELRWGTDCRAC